MNWSRKILESAHKARHALSAAALGDRLIALPCADGL